MKRHNKKLSEHSLVIDKNRLDEEWLNQPKLVFQVASSLAEAKVEADIARANVDIAKAECDKKIRANPSKYGLPEKTTEIMISNTAIRQKKCAKAQFEYRELKHKVDILIGLVEAVHHRKSALENLVMLHGRDYFSSPIARDDTSKRHIEEMKKKKARSKRKKR